MSVVQVESNGMSEYSEHGFGRWCHWEESNILDQLWNSSAEDKAIGSLFVQSSQMAV